MSSAKHSSSTDEPAVVVDTDAQRLESEIRRRERQGIPIPAATREDLEAIFGEMPAG